jgi:hypothetical protein
MNSGFEIIKYDKISIYITHGSVVSLSTIAKQFYAKEPEVQVLLLYNKSREYVLQTRRCSAIVNQGLLEKFSLESLPEKYPFLNLDDLLQFVRHFSIPFYRVCCDVNLTLSGGHVVSYEAHLLLKKSRPYQIIFIHSTPECVENAEHYLRGGLRVVDNTARTRHLFQLPLSVKQGGIFDRKNNFLRFIESEQHQHPTWTEERARVVAKNIICHNIYCFFVFKKIINKAPSVNIKNLSLDVFETKDILLTFYSPYRGRVTPEYVLGGSSILEEKVTLTRYIKPTIESVERHACCVIS